MAIQHRRGIYNRFDPTRLVAGEWAIVVSGDTSARDGMAAYICFAAGTVKRVATFEDMAENIADANEQLIQQLTTELTENVDEVVDRAADIAETCEDNEATRVAAERTRVSNETARVNAESSRRSAESARASAEQTRIGNETTRVSAENARASAEQTRIGNETTRVSAENARASAEQARIDNESIRVSAESARVSAESGRVTAEAGRVSAEEGRVAAEAEREDAETARAATFASIEERVEYYLRYTCEEGEYDPDTRRPVIDEPDTLTRYFVPSAHPTTDDWWIEWEWDEDNERWEKVGTTEASFTAVSDEQINAIAAGTTITGSEVLTTTGVSRVFSKLAELFSVLGHEHSASEITSGSFTVPQGGTGVTAHTTNSVLVGNGASALKNVASAAGALFATGENAEPQFGTLPIEQGGTGATTAKAARQSLGIHADLTWGDLKETLTWGQLRDG